MVNRRPAAQRAHGQTVEFLVPGDDVAPMPDRHVLYLAGVIRVIGPAKPIDTLTIDRIIRQAFKHVILETVRRVVPRRAGRGVEHRLPHDHHPAPQPPFINPNVPRVGRVIKLRREDDRLCGRAHGAKLRPRRDKQRAGLVGIRQVALRHPLDHRPRLNRQLRRRQHMHQPVQIIHVGLRPRRVHRHVRRPYHCVRRFGP